ncbi:DUF6009 family protein [Streptomyces lavendulae]|uniref:DUF6009 family protein n=1 Tax=Streptomyces lavendulae TaxID=1914 RepID=UPI0036C5657F
MSSLLTPGEITHEDRVVWLEEPEGLDYVRQALDKTPRRRGRPPYHRPGRMIGFTELDETAEADPDTGLQRRRVFYLLPHDRDNEPDGLYREGAPGEAVDPRTITPGQVGRKTERSQRGGPRPLSPDPPLPRPVG